MYTKTRHELVSRALEKVGAIRAGDSADPDDYARVDSVVEVMLDDLAARDITYVASPDALPAAGFEHLATCLAYHVANEFGPPIPPEMKIMAERDLRAQRGSGPTYGPLQTEYF